MTTRQEIKDKLLKDILDAPDHQRKQQSIVLFQAFVDGLKIDAQATHISTKNEELQCPLCLATFKKEDSL